MGGGGRPRQTGGMAPLPLFAILASSWTLVPGSLAPGRGPDGNSVLLDAPAGLILIDSGRHPEHQHAILAAARARGRPIAAIVNSHWHLDHSGGNGAIRAAFPGIPLLASTAIDGALTGFLARSAAQARAHLASGKAPPAQAAEIERDLARTADTANLRPDMAIAGDGPVSVAGRTLQLRLARHAVTAGDVWLWEPRERLVVAGDLVVAPVPLFDTACPEGWRAALASIARTPFRTLVPGHGAPMDRAAFRRWRVGFDRLLDCAESTAPAETCIAGWQRDAASFIPAGREAYVAGLLRYYFDTRLRAPLPERRRYCPGGLDDRPA